jgi:hypothetical protein
MKKVDSLHPTFMGQQILSKKRNESINHSAFDQNYFECPVTTTVQISFLIFCKMFFSCHETNASNKTSSSG